MEVVRQSQVEGKVNFEGWRPREDVLQLMTDSDIFLFAGLRDGGGQVIVEAMSVGKPVVCLDIGGPSIHVTADTGIKVAATSPEASVKDLASALERLHSDSELRQEMGKAARARVEEIYHWDRAGERISDIYLRVTLAKRYD
jgi:glycosyltransferase involved in cell wall biosynthesis